MIKKVIFVLAIITVSSLFAKIEMGTPFSDGVVLQRWMLVPVWGKAEANANVTVSFAGASLKAVADAQGNWIVRLPKMTATRERRSMTIVEKTSEGKVADTVKVYDVVVGEVWMCAGQSNTDCPIWGDNPRYRDGWGAMTLTSVNKPFVRLVKTPKVGSVEPLKGFRVEWMPMTPDLFDKAFKAGKLLPSAMGYYYALELANALDIPIGLVDCSWGGTNIDAWTPRSGYDGIEGLEMEKNWKSVEQCKWKNTMRKGTVVDWFQQPSALWNGMVAAYTPMACRGMIWYQGCHNAGEHGRYCKKMHALYNGWAKEFENPGLKIYFAQLAPWGYPDIASIQKAQAKFDAEEPNAGMAVINDVGNLNDIHPNDKRTVAKRLVLHALRRDYGWKSVRDNSPTLKSWKVVGNTFVLSFNDAEGWYIYNPDRTMSVGFEVRGADGIWKPARILNLVEDKNGKGQAEWRGLVRGKELVIASDEVKEPVKLRYLASPPWFGSLYNEVCLPLGAFQIDAPTM